MRDLRLQFMYLNQGDRTVAEYEREFRSLSRCAPELVALEALKCQKLCNGLHPRIFVYMAGDKDDDFSELTRKAKEFERDNLCLRPWQAHEVLLGLQLCLYATFVVRGTLESALGVLELVLDMVPWNIF
ncbi:hypothetical protein V6N11_034014 [Hibiscus sabdariffa]|uniref:Retrotransposon gag domain-containing protein n=1 Tax=Hibiscus sabdariffa TaxID=183260 RepID=A0ABR2S158_9ROSI